MVRDTALLGQRHLVGADVESTINRGRIAVDDLAATAPGERESECALPRRGRTQDGDDLAAPQLRSEANDEHATKKQTRISSPSCCDQREHDFIGVFIVEKRHGEERGIRGVLGGSGAVGFDADERSIRGVVERLDRARAGDREVRQGAVLVDVERDDDVPAHRHHGHRNQPVPLDLLDEPADPRTEFTPLGVELNGRTERPAALRVLELIRLDVAIEVAQRVAERPSGRARAVLAVP